MVFDDTELIDELRRAHGAHTLILYGSYARGDATDESDIDVACFADVDDTSRDARLWHGIYLDGFVYPTKLATAPDLDMLKLVGGRVLVDDRGLATPLLDQLAEIDRRGPMPLRADDCQMRRMWATKTLRRLRHGDLEADYRRHQLMYELLQDEFAYRGEWFRGAKLALAELARSRPTTYALFARALSRSASFDDIRAVVEHVTGLPT
jgi:hypothetical protein